MGMINSIENRISQSLIEGRLGRWHVRFIDNFNLLRLEGKVVVALIETEISGKHTLKRKFSFIHIEFYIFPKEILRKQLRTMYLLNADTSRHV